MSQEWLGGTSFDGHNGWNGAGKEMYNDAMLGIANTNLRNPNMQGAVAIVYNVNGKDDAIFGGYDFGHSQLSGAEQDFCWAGSDPLPAELGGISITYRDLNSRDLPLLLRYTASPI